MKERSIPVSLRRRLLRSGLLLSLTLVLVSCGTPSSGSRQPSDTPTAAATATAPTMPSPPAVASVAATPDGSIGASPSAFRSDAAEIGAILWTAAIDPETKAPLDPVTSFSAETPTLYAVFPVVRIRQGTTIAATWTYNDTTLPTLDSAISAPVDTEEIWIEFHLTLATGETWPSGTYAIAIAINGEPAAQAAVEVVE